MGLLKSLNGLIVYRVESERLLIVLTSHLTIRLHRVGAPLQVGFKSFSTSPSLKAQSFFASSPSVAYEVGVASLQSEKYFPETSFTPGWRAK